MRPCSWVKRRNPLHCKADPAIRLNPVSGSFHDSGVHLCHRPPSRALRVEGRRKDDHEGDETMRDVRVGDEVNVIGLVGTLTVVRTDMCGGYAMLVQNQCNAQDTVNHNAVSLTERQLLKDRLGLRMG